MALKVDQLVYTSFSATGFKGLAGPQVPVHVQHSFVEAVVHQYWNAYSPPTVGFRSIYLHQLSLQECLFGWLYNDGIDEMGRDGVPYFLCYYLVQEISESDLNLIFDCLEHGPLTIVDRQQIPTALESVVIPESLQYAPTRAGVMVPFETRGRCHLQLEKHQCLDFCVPLEPQVKQTEASLEIEETESLTMEELALLSPVLEPTPSPQETTPRHKTLTNKIALLIGVSEYGTGLQALPGTLKNVEAIRGVLEHQEQGGFDEVKTLINPDPQTMAEAIESLFLDRKPEDMVLLYFSGYVSVLEPHDKIGLTTHLSRLGSNGNVVRSTVITADFVNDVMGDSRSQHQTLILDWCTDKGIPTLDAVRQNVKFAPQFQGEKRTILMSAASTQTAIIPPKSEGSDYTFYLVEGLKTGAADLNCDGEISLDEWHAYAQRKLIQASPALDPVISGARTVAKTVMASSPIHESKFKYRKQVEECSQEGKISIENRVVLDTLSNILGLDLDEASTIETEVLKPRREYYQKRQDYATAFTEAIRKDYPLTPDLSRQFNFLQRELGLTDADIVPVESELVRRLDILKEPGLIGKQSAQIQDQSAQTFVQRATQAVEKARHAVRPLSSRVKISTRHLLARCQRNMVQHPANILRKLQRLTPLKMTFLCLGLSVGTALLVVAVNQQQMANRKEQVKPELPKAENPLSRVR